MKYLLKIFIFSTILFTAHSLYSQNTDNQTPKSADSEKDANEVYESTYTPADNNKLKIEENNSEFSVPPMSPDGSTNIEGTTNPEQNNTPEHVKQWYKELQQARRDNDLVKVNELQKLINDYYGVKPAEPSHELQSEYPAKIK